jgi:hypothetical protein
MEDKNARVPIKEGTSRGNLNPPPKMPKPSTAPPPQSKPTTSGEATKPNASTREPNPNC